MWYNEYYLPWYNWFYGITPEKEKEPEYINIAQLETEQEKVEIIPFEEPLPTEPIAAAPPPSPEKKVIPFEIELPPPKSDPIRINPKRHWKRRY